MRSGSEASPQRREAKSAGTSVQIGDPVLCRVENAVNGDEFVVVRVQDAVHVPLLSMQAEATVYAQGRGLMASGHFSASFPRDAIVRSMESYHREATESDTVRVR